MESLFTKKRPSRFENQLNGKSIQENYNQVKRENQEFFGSLLLDPKTEKEIEKQVYQAVEDALDDLFKDFPTKL